MVVKTFSFVSRYKPILFLLSIVHPWATVAQPSFYTNGSAEEIAEHCYRLTHPKSPNDLGSIWSEIPIQLNQSFDLRFSINFGCSSVSGEGVAFVLHSDPRQKEAMGCPGSSLGFGNLAPCEDEISPSFAIEFDSKYTKGNADLYSPHITLIRNADFSLPLQKPVKMREENQDVRDCEFQDIRICWTPSKQFLQIFFNGELRVSYVGNLISFFGKNQNLTWGFTASSGQVATQQMICIQSVDISIDENYEEKELFKSAVGIFPNPLREKITISVDFDVEQLLNIQLFDVSGKIIQEYSKQKTKEKKFYFNLPGLPSGVYYASVSNGKQRVSKKIVHIGSIRA